MLILSWCVEYVRASGGVMLIGCLFVGIRNTHGRQNTIATTTTCVALLEWASVIDVWIGYVLDGM